MTRPDSRARGAHETLRCVRVGDFDVYPLIQLHYFPPPERFFPELAGREIDRAQWYWQPPYVASGRLAIDMGGFLIRRPGRTVLVDLGLGNDKPRPNPNFHQRADPWLSLLERAGSSPADVDTVVYTHLHVDHVGFGTTLVDGAWVPTFPTARHVTTAAEWGHWTTDAARADLARLGDYVTDSIEPIRAAGLLDLAAPDAELGDGIRLVPAAGHTPGNVCVAIESEGARAVFCGDMVHHPLQFAYPDWSTDYCVDYARAGRARERLLASIADTEALLFPAHLPHGSPGRITRSAAGGYRYHPVPGEPV